MDEDRPGFDRRTVLGAATGAVLASSAAAAPPPSDIVMMDARGLSAAIAARRISCVEVMNAFLDHIAAINPRVNAIVALQDRDGLLAQARERDAQVARGEIMGPLHGFPHAVKDLQLVKGIRSTSGSPILKDFIPDHDALPEPARDDPRDRQRRWRLGSRPSPACSTSGPGWPTRRAARCPAPSCATAGFTANRSARALSGGRTGLIGVMLPMVEATYFSAILSGTAEALYEQDMRMVLCPTLHHHEREVTLLDRLMQGTTDGAVLMLPEESNDELKTLRRRGLRVRDRRSESGARRGDPGGLRGQRDRRARGHGAPPRPRPSPDRRDHGPAAVPREQQSA